MEALRINVKTTPFCQYRKGLVFTIMHSMKITIQAASLDDLTAINQVIESAVMNWHLPERVKRLSLSSMTYTEADYAYYQFVKALCNNTICGVLVLDHDTYRPEKTSLLHGLYVSPDNQRLGVGSKLIKEAERLSILAGSEHITVKAQKDAQGFFLSKGMVKLGVKNSQSDYATRYSKHLHTP